MKYLLGLLMFSLLLVACQSESTSSSNDTESDSISSSEPPSRVLKVEEEIVTVGNAEDYSLTTLEQGWVDGLSSRFSDHICDCFSQSATSSMDDFVKNHFNDCFSKFFEKGSPQLDSLQLQENNSAPDQLKYRQWMLQTTDRLLKECPGFQSQWSAYLEGTMKTYGQTLSSEQIDANIEAYRQGITRNQGNPANLSVAHYSLGGMYEFKGDQAQASEQYLKSAACGKPSGFFAALHYHSLEQN